MTFHSFLAILRRARQFDLQTRCLVRQLHTGFVIAPGLSCNQTAGFCMRIDLRGKTGSGDMRTAVCLSVSPPRAKQAAFGPLSKHISSAPSMANSSWPSPVTGILSIHHSDKTVTGSSSLARVLPVRAAVVKFQPLLRWTACAAVTAAAQCAPVAGRLHATREDVEAGRLQQAEARLGVCRQTRTGCQTDRSDDSFG